MSKRKGLSFDEKKATLLAAMHSEASFYTLKELENLGKSNGVIPQAVKEVVEALCADGEIQNDKVGSQQLFWALLSQRSCALRNKRRKLEEEMLKLEADKSQSLSQLSELKSSDPPSEQEVADTRAKAVSERKRCEDLRSQIAALERSGPGTLSEKKAMIDIGKQAANRWADNICSFRSMFVRERRGEVSTAQFNKSFDLPEDFDYLE
mmetsp:Transcript_63907/g.101312  ORF Transcript_63907/g.101312 Transcript_63907/m.101312 type:complete len:208 (+) Transcript_63907:47-670(+)